MIVPGNDMIEAELSLDQAPQLSQTQTLQQLDNTLVIQVILWVYTLNKMLLVSHWLRRSVL